MEGGVGGEGEDQRTKEREKREVVQSDIIAALNKPRPVFVIG